MKNKIILCTCIFSLVVFSIGCQKNTKTNTSEQNTKTEVSEPTKEMDKVESDKPQKEENKSKDENTTADKKSIMASIYSYDINKPELIKNTAEIKELQPQLLIDELIKLKIAPEGTIVNNFNIETVDNLKTIYLDLNSNFVNYGLGSSAEISTLDCLANTFLENYDCNRLKLTINGNEYESGHLSFEENQYLEFKK